MQKLFRLFLPYLLLIAFLIIISILAQALLSALPHLKEEMEFQAFVFGSILLVGYSINRISPKTVIPSFVWAIFAGMALQPILSIYTERVGSMRILIEVFAALVLFAGGLEIPFKNFKRWFFPIASLSFVGVIVSAIVFSFILLGLMSWLGSFEIALIPSIIVLSAALASTDPTAIIPTLSALRFKRSFIKQIAISESALTDVSGSIVTRFLLLAFVTASVTQSGSLLSYFAPILKKSAYDALALQIMTGIIVGYLGYVLIKRLYAVKKSDDEKNGESLSDPALLLSVPIFTFVLGNFLGGAGFLAAFVSGLLTDIQGNIKKVSHFYQSLLDHLVKPFIFIFLGALVPLPILFIMAPIGIVAALLFMFIARPFVVFLSLFPWLIRGEFKVKDLVFLSLVRETGIIAAVLIIIASTYHIIDSDFVVAVGMWIILLTLVLEPPLTPYLAKTIGVAEGKQAS